MSSDAVLTELRAIRAELRQIRERLEPEEGLVSCRQCGGLNVEDTGTLEERRETCLDCGRSWTEEVRHG